MEDSTPIEQTVFDETGPDIDEARRITVDYPILMVLEGGDLKTRFRIDESELVIGRDIACRLHIADPKISRKHARLTYSNFGVRGEEPVILLEDLGSTNGTMMHGKLLEEPLVLSVGDVAYLCDEKLVFHDGSPS